MILAILWAPCQRPVGFGDGCHTGTSEVQVVNAFALFMYVVFVPHMSDMYIVNVTLLSCRCLLPVLTNH